MRGAERRSNPGAQPWRCLPGSGKRLKNRTLYVYDDYDAALRQRRTLSRRRATLALFIAGILFAPVPYFMMVVGGLVPLAWIIAATLQGIFVALPKVTMEAFFMVGVLLAHVVILGGLIYGLAWLIGRILYLALKPRAAAGGVLVIAAIAAAASFFQIYSLPGHNSAPAANLVQVFAATF